EVIASLFILVFVYTAMSKLMAHQQFEVTISQSPLLHDVAGILSWTIPIVELVISLFLLVPTFRAVGLLLSFFLMLVFTMYLAYMLMLDTSLPCSCGGVISQMSWKQHLVFNLVLTITAGFGVFLIHSNKDFIAINRISRKPV